MVLGYRPCSQLSLISKVRLSLYISVWFWISLIAIRRNGYPYRDKSWHTLNKFSVTFFFIITVQNMALEVELEALDFINTFKLKNIRSRLAFLIQEYTHLLSNNEPIRIKKAYLLFYCKHCIELYTIQLTFNFQNYLVLKYSIIVKPKTNYIKKQY